MKSRKNTAPFLSSFAHNKLAKVVSIALVSLLKLRIAEAEAADVGVNVKVDDQNLTSSATLDLSQLLAVEGRPSIIQTRADWSGIPYDLNPANARNVTDAGQASAFDHTSISLNAGQIGYLVKNGGGLSLTDASVNAQNISSKAFVALDGGKIALSNINLVGGGNSNEYGDNKAVGLLAVGDGSTINADNLKITGAAPQYTSDVVAIGGGQINLVNSQLGLSHGIEVQDAGSRVTLKNSQAYGARVGQGSMAIDDSTLHATLFVIDGAQIDIKNSIFDSQVAGGSATVQINNDFSDQQARVTIADSLISKGPTQGNQAVEITGSVDFSMTGGRIEAADIGIAAIQGFTSQPSQQSVLLDNVQVSVNNTMDGQRVARGVVLSGGQGDSQLTLRNSHVNVSAEDSAATGEFASGLDIFDQGIDVLLDHSDVRAHMDGGNPALGARLNGSDARVELINGSQLIGQSNGVQVNGRAIESAEAARLIVDNSTVRGEESSAIQATDFGKLDVRVQNHGSLESGNGVALNVQDQADVNLTLDNSDVRGDIVSDNQTAEQVYGRDSDWNPLTGLFKSTAKVNLQNHASLTGATSQVDAMSIDNRSQWNLTGNSDVGRLQNDGTVAFTHSDDSFKNLLVRGDLTGNGSFRMNTQLATLQGDLLTVEGQTQGNHTLVVADSGRAPSTANQQLMLVDGNGGSGQFNLYGNHVDAGAFRYALAQQGDDWFLRNSATNPNKPGPENLSKGANAALGNQAATATLWSAQMNALVKRIGELRMGEDNGGVWARGIGKRFEVDNGSSRAFDQDVQGMEIGADTAIKLEGSKLYVGGMIGTASSDQSFGEGASGKIDSKLIGAYATWLDDNGYYIDTVAKYNRFDNQVKSTTNMGKQVKGDYKNHGYGADVEVGKHIKMKDGWFVEPQVELSYTNTAGGNYDTSDGMRVEAADSESLQGRVGSLFGRSMQLSNGMKVQPYAKASYVHEFEGNSSVNVNGVSLDNQMDGTRTELGLGGVLQVSEKTKVSLDIEQASGKEVDEPWALNLGVRYLW